MPAPVSSRRVVLEADGGSRGNPGPAAYGAVLKDATGTVIAEEAKQIGTATNNVAEYRGLIAGLELAGRHAPEAEIEVRMDSKLVVEQMAGRWKIKHPGLRPLAERARALAGRVTRWTWVPRDRNTEADRLLNQALDGTAGRPPASGPTALIDPDTAAPGTTTLLLIAANDPAQAKEVADRVAAQHHVAAVLSPRLPPARELGQVVAHRLGVPLVEDEDAAWATSRMLNEYRGQTVATVAPPEFVASLVGSALEVPVSALSRIRPEPGSVTVLCYDSDGTPALRQLAVAL